MGNEDGGLSVDQAVEGDPRHWRVLSSEELFHPDKVTGTEFRAEQLFDLQDAGAFTDVGGAIIGGFGVVKQVTTRFDPEHTRQVDFIIDEDVDLTRAQSYYQNLIMELSVQLAWHSGGGFSVNLRPA